MNLMKPIDEREEAREVEWEPARRWWTGRVNLLASVNADITLPAHLHIIDATLREGEEVPDTTFTLDQKVRLAHAIREVGFRELEVGYAGVIQEHYELVRRLKREGFDATIASHTRIYGRPEEWKKEIDRNLEAGAELLTMVGFATEVGTATTPWLSKAEVAPRVAECVAYARSQGARVSFGLADLVRTSFEQIVACYRAAAEAGIDRAYVYDGQGAARPEAIRFLTRFIRDLVGPRVEIAAHVHDTFGLAQANAVAALTSGAAAVDAVPLGLGDGAGITASEEVAAAMEILYGVPTGIRLDGLRRLCLEVADAFGIPMPKTRAVVGENMYRHQIDSHVAAILRGAWHSWEVARPEVLGQERQLGFGHAKLRAGRSGAVAALLDALGISPTDAELEAIMGELRAATQHQPSLDVNQARAIVERIVGVRTS
jgi:isopropylmalate/homocitrate/citramalate synthase